MSSKIGQILSGSEFNEIFKRTPFCISVKETDNFVDGININSNQLNQINMHHQSKFFFTCHENISGWIDYDNKIMHYIEIPDDALVYIKALTVFETSKFILKERVDIWTDYDIYSSIAEKTPYVLRYISKHVQQNKLHELYELCKFLAQTEFNILRYIPKHMKTNEICALTVKRHGSALKFAPKNMRTIEICMLAIHCRDYILRYVPEHLKKLEICTLAVGCFGLNLRYVPNNLKSIELCKLAVQQNGWALQYVPEDMKTLEICQIALSNNRMVRFWVPIQFKKYRHFLS